MSRKILMMSLMACALAFVTSVNSFNSFAQNDVYNFTMVEEMPAFNGENIAQVPKWFLENAKFPESIDLEQLKGKSAFVSIIIGTEGKLLEAKILKSISKEVDETIISTLMESEGWTPGKQNGNPVKVSAMIKITF